MLNVGPGWVYLFTVCLWEIFKINMFVGLGPAAAWSCSDGSGCVPAGASWSCWTPVRTNSSTSSTAPGKTAAAPHIEQREKIWLHQTTLNFNASSVKWSCCFTWIWFWKYKERFSVALLCPQEGRHHGGVLSGWEIHRDGRGQCLCLRPDKQK